MIEWFEWNGLDSREFDLLIRNKDTFKKAKKNLTFVKIPGKSRSLIIDDGSYSNVELKYSVTLAPKNVSKNTDINYFYATDKISNWLVNDGDYHILKDSYDPLYYRKACLSDEFDIKQVFFDIGKFDIPFTCDPYRYSEDGNKTLTFNLSNGSPAPIYNPESYVALPKIRIYADGTSQTSSRIFAIGNEAYHFDEFEDFLDIDSETMNVYKGTTNQNNMLLSTTFPEIPSGASTVYFIAGISKIEIIPRWRTI